MTDKQAMKPLIGITTSELRPGTLKTLTRSGGDPLDETFLGTTYFRAVERAGGLPVMIAPGDPDVAADVVPRLDGLVLAGGPDIDPFFYGATPTDELGPTFPEADRCELAVGRRALELAKPVLGVCRGAQLLNILHGGTLVQHVDGCRQSQPGDVTTQTIQIVQRTRLHGVLRARRFDVNTFHHQAIGKLGEGLRVSARTADGMIKALEAAALPFVVGIQWHAEALDDGLLFDALVAAAEHKKLRIAA